MDKIMNRRLLVAALAGGVAAPALAQGTAPATGVAPAGSMGAATAPSAGMTGKSAMGQAEQDHAMRTAMAGMASLQMADIALEKAHNAKVKEFAKFEHDEQTTIAEVLKSMDPGMTPPAPDAKTAEMIEKLKGMSGAAFDKAFITGQIDGHEKLLAIQEDYLKSGKDRESLNVTKLARGMIREHLALLTDLHKMVG